MHSRDLFSIGSAPVTATITNGSARVDADQREPLVLPLTAQTQDGTIEATLNVYLGTRSGERLAALTTADGTIAWDARPRPPEEDVVSITRSLHAETALGTIQTLIQARADQLNELRELTRLSGYLEQTNQRLDGLYQPFASIHLPEQLLEELWSLMSDEGFYGLFEGGRRSRPRAGNPGILGSNGIRPHSIEGTFAEQGLDFRSSWDALERFATRFNLFVLTEKRDRVFCTI